MIIISVKYACFDKMLKHALMPIHFAVNTDDIKHKN